MNVDLTGVIEGVATPGLGGDTMEQLKRDVADCWQAVDVAVDENEHGYVALDQPNRVDIEAIRSATEDIEANHVVTVGIGGSALGAATLFEATGTHGHPVLDNVDPEMVSNTLEALPLEETALVVVSRSGTTIETRALFKYCREQFEAAGVNWQKRTIIVTGDGGPLRSLVKDENIRSLSVPAGVPGRFSVFSTMGLTAPMIAGVDVERVVAGARAAATYRDGSLLSDPGLALGGTLAWLGENGKHAVAMMPYAEGLECFTEWFAQLWAESLGKDGGGQIPLRALGVTDQHSQLQLYRAGRPSIVPVLLRPKQRPSCKLQEPTTNVEDLGQLMDVEFQATAESLEAVSRPHLEIEIEALRPTAIGRLLYHCQESCILAGEYLGLNPFDQPAVEWGKDRTRELLKESEQRRERELVVQ